MGLEVDTKALKSLTGRAAKQMRFAGAVALTQVARDSALDVLPARTRQVFDKPIGFTQRAFGFRGANKARLEAGAEVFVKRDQAEYFIFRTMQSLRGGALQKAKRDRAALFAAGRGSFERRGKKRVAGDKGTFRSLGAPIPVGMPLTSSGNLRRGALKRVMDQAVRGDSRGRVFLGRAKTANSYREGDKWRGLTRDVAIWQRPARPKRKRLRAKDGRFRKGRPRAVKKIKLLARFEKQTRHRQDFDFGQQVLVVKDTRLAQAFVREFGKAMATAR